MIEKLFIYFILIISLSSQIFSVPIHKNCFISDDLLNLIKQLDGYVEPLKENEVPIGMEFELVREYSKSDIFKKFGWDTQSSAVTFVINGKIISVDLNDNSPLSRRLELFMTDDRIENSAVIILNFTIDRIPFDECDGTSHLKPPIH